MFLSARLKSEHDAHIRRNLPVYFAEKIIAENRTVVPYLIQQEIGALKVADHCYTVGRGWETIKRVVCDRDDALAHKEDLAKSIGVHSSRLKLVCEIDLQAISYA